MTIPVIDVLSILLDRTERPIQGIATYTLVDSASRFKFQAEPILGTWECVDLSNGHEVGYDATTEVLKTGDTEDRRPTFPTFPTHPAVSLLFPLELPVWGRSHDEWIPVSAKSDENETAVVLFNHRHDRAIYGSLEVDLQRRHATRWISPTSSVVYEQLDRTENDPGNSQGE